MLEKKLNFIKIQRIYYEVLSMYNNKKIAVLIPCYNESVTIKKVINDFKKELPNAKIYVYNNNSTDDTAIIAKNEGAIVVNESQQGKGNVVRSMFRDIEADVYIMVDGDDTYPANEAHNLIYPIIENNADMVIGDRLSSTYFTENKRPFHNFGNSLVRNLVNRLFHSHINDIMTGYRAFSKRFVKCMPVISDGFQIETEMTVYSLVYHMNIVEIPVTYRDRPEGSVSKLSTFKDGFKVLLTLFNLFKDNRPFLLFGLLSFAVLFIGLLIGLPVLLEFIKTYKVLKIPTAMLASSLVIASLLLFSIGIILDAIKNAKQYLFISNMNKIIESINKKHDN